MIETGSIQEVDGEELQEWLSEALLPHLPEDTQTFIIPRPWDSTGESRYAAVVNVEDGVTIPELLASEVTEHSRGPYRHYYVDVVVSAAVTAGELEGDRFFVNHSW